MKKADLKEALRIVGAQGGKKAAKNMTAEQRTARAKKAAVARWQLAKESKRKGA